MTGAGERSRSEGKDSQRQPIVVAAPFLWRRFFSFLLDAGLLTPIGALGSIRLWMLLEGATVANIDTIRGDVVTILMVTWAAMLLVTAYNRWWRQGTTGQSWGKRIMGLRLVDAVGNQPIGIRAAFLRDVLNGLIALGPALALVHPRGLTLGDVAVGAVVLEDR